MIYKFDKFSIDESYLESNHAPIYHLTNNFNLEFILDENELKLGWVENPFFNKKIKIVSFTRNKNLDLSHYKESINVILSIDKNKLIIDGYKLYPYDFFVNIGKENLPKSNGNRKYPYEFEEASIKSISNLDNYLISVDFLYESFYNSYRSVNILKNKNIPIYEAGRRIF